MEEMKAGRELDALVAEKVMGWKRREPTECDGMLGEVPGGGALCECGWNGNWGEDHLDERGSTPPAYSTDIAAAWEVWSALSKRTTGFSFTLDWCRIPFLTDGWEASINMDDLAERVAARTDTAPLAICLAALKAVGLQE